MCDFCLNNSKYTPAAGSAGADLLLRDDTRTCRAPYVESYGSLHVDVLEALVMLTGMPTPNLQIYQSCFLEICPQTLSEVDFICNSLYPRHTQ